MTSPTRSGTRHGWGIAPESPLGESPVPSRPVPSPNTNLTACIVSLGSETSGRRCMRRSAAISGVSS